VHKLVPSIRSPVSQSLKSSSDVAQGAVRSKPCSKQTRATLIDMHVLQPVRGQMAIALGSNPFKHKHGRLRCLERTFVLRELCDSSAPASSTSHPCVAQCFDLQEIERLKASHNLTHGWERGVAPESVDIPRFLPGKAAVL
jgi:hypothetical protein